MIHPTADNDASGQQLGLHFPTERPRQPRRIWTVSALVAEIRGQVERAYPECWVEGEISNLRIAPSGHIYFTLKDEEGQLSVVLFRRQAGLLRFRPEAAVRVLVRGRISVYEERSQLQLIAETLEPMGVGSLQFAFEQLKQKLQQEGLFDAEHKKPLPHFPRSVGIVTSRSGAVIHDFLTIAGRRHAGLDVLLYPATVQGDQAAAEIAAGLHYFNRAKNVDAIVIARGGGSAEDLAAFNTETVARAIAASAIPVVSAVGHETDFTIADFAADLRAPTPSAAAELLTAMQHGIEERVATLDRRLLRACQYSLSLAHRRLAAVSPQAAIARMRSTLDRAQQRVDEQHFRLSSAWQTQLRAIAEALQQLHARLLRQSSFQTLRLRGEHCAAASARLHRAFDGRLRVARRAMDALSQRILLHAPTHRCRQLRQAVAYLDMRGERAAVAGIDRGGAAHRALEGRLMALSPLAVLDRGYSLTFSSSGRLLRDSAGVALGESITTRLALGALQSTVIDTKAGS